jgi:hypothetical protein
VEANYQFMLRLCHVWDRLLLRTAFRGRGEFRVTVERKQNSVCRGATAPKEPGKPQRPADTQH